ncbi:hypothetical protein ACFQH6_02065 [Halobacteriaceae archaeon GCM10025711]
MSKSTRLTCPNCDRRTSLVHADDEAAQAEFTCPNCDEPIVVIFDAS